MANKTQHLQLTDELQEQASLYAIGAMPESERREYVRHVEDDDCAICRNEVAEFQSVASFMAWSRPLETPSPLVRERLMAQARGPALAAPPIPAPRQNRKWLQWVSGFAAVAASTALVFALNDNARLRDLANSLSTRVSQLESQMTEQRVRLTMLTSPQLRVVSLAGQGANASASGRIFWDRAKRRWFFYVQNLPPVGKDKSYQLWFVPVAGNPVSASVFNTDASGSAEIEIPLPSAADELKAAAVTTEPAGGLPQPSGAFALLGASN